MMDMYQARAGNSSTDFPIRPIGLLHDHPKGMTLKVATWCQAHKGLLRLQTY